MLSGWLISTRIQNQNHLAGLAELRFFDNLFASQAITAVERIERKSTETGAGKRLGAYREKEEMRGRQYRERLWALGCIVDHLRCVPEPRESAASSLSFTSTAYSGIPSIPSSLQRNPGPERRWTPSGCRLVPEGFFLMEPDVRPENQEIPYKFPRVKTLRSAGFASAQP